MKITRPDSMLRQLTSEPIEKPCAADWDEMRGDDKVRHCDECDREVYAISKMTELEAELRLLNAPDALPCIRYARDASGNVIHAADLVRSDYLANRPGTSARAFVMASALGSALVTRDAGAKPPVVAAAEPTQCVPYEQPAPPPPAPSAGAAAAPATRPAPAPPAAPTAAPQPEPVMLGGAPPPMRVDPVFGTLDLVSKVQRTFTVGSVVIAAPHAGFRMTVGNFVAEVTDQGKKPRKVKFKIEAGKSTKIDLDKR